MFYEIILYYFAMCGIAGQVTIQGDTVDKNELERIAIALQHRGPDDNGVYIHNNVGLVHTRLAIIDLRPEAAQPMHSKDKRYSIVFNGEIYNFKELRDQLRKKGIEFTTNGDTEVLLQMYVVYKEQCLDHLRGMFAFAIYDKEEQTVFLARDHVGQKPLYYTHNQKIFAFASEICGLQAMRDVTYNIDEQAIYDYLTLMYLPAPRTGYTSIHKLPAAHYGVYNIRNNTFTIQRYWQLAYQAVEKSYEDWKESTAQIIEECVRMQTVSDVPVGAFLSGGIDSSTIVAMLHKIGNTVETFSIGSDDPLFNEAPAAKQIAEYFSAMHTEIPLNAQSMYEIPNMVKKYGEPFADPSVLPTYILCKNTRKKVTVALSGDGGDENFLGYIRYPIAHFASRWQKAPKFIHKAVKMATGLALKVSPNTFTYRCNRFQGTVLLPEYERYLQYLSFFTEEEKRNIFTKHYNSTAQFYSEKVKDIGNNIDNIFHRYAGIDIQTYLADDLEKKVDSAAMAFGLEVRAPLLDHKLLEHTASMPIEWKIHGKIRKYILKEILYTMLPKHYTDQPKKGFRVPLNSWMRTHAKDYVTDSLLANNAPILQLCSKQGLEKFLHTYYTTNIDYSDHVWSLIWLNEWLMLPSKQ